MIRLTPNKSIDPNYNYLSDVVDNSSCYTYKAEDYRFCSGNGDEKCGVCSTRVLINNKCYRDPDSYSVSLYKDLGLLSSSIFDLNLLKLEDKEKYNNEKMFYGSDYIGVSRHWAKVNELYSEIEIGKMLETFRKIGGHMLWPKTEKNHYGKKYMTINQARGGPKGVYDRFDITLQMIKCFYFKNECLYSIQLNKAIEHWDYWFNEYGENDIGFKNFIDAFLLNDFVDKEYNVLSLVNDKPIQEDEKVTSIFESKDNFDKYVRNSMLKIDNRTKKVCGVIA